jgi:hypothetical protein
MNTDLVIESNTDWQRFTHFSPAGGLDPVVDPMIYRTAEVFLLGGIGVSQALGSVDDVCKSIQRNLDSLMTFFDLLILSRQLPIIDYGLTFDPNVGIDSDNIINQCNQNEQLLVSVHVMAAASIASRAAAFDMMKDRTFVPKSIADDLREDMSALEHKWKPDLSPLGVVQDEDLPVLRFLYGATLFGVFAQMAGVGHVFQPRRSKALLAACLHADVDLAEDEERLYKKLAQVMGKSAGSADCTAELDGLPPFLPYLLSKNPKCPADLLGQALEMRKTGMIKDYRDWRKGLIDDWREKGVIRAQYRKELAAIARRVKREMSTSAESNIELKVSLTGLDPSWKVPVDQIWGWISRQLPGRRYMKILTRLAFAQAEYEQIGKHVGSLWALA